MLCLPLLATCCISSARTWSGPGSCLSCKGQPNTHLSTPSEPPGSSWAGSHRHRRGCILKYPPVTAWGWVLYPLTHFTTTKLSPLTCCPLHTRGLASALTDAPTDLAVVMALLLRLISPTLVGRECLQRPAHFHLCNQRIQERACLSSVNLTFR